jgi:hypothetical protein
MSHCFFDFHSALTIHVSCCQFCDPANIDQQRTLTSAAIRELCVAWGNNELLFINAMGRFSGFQATEFIVSCDFL